MAIELLSSIGELIAEAVLVIRTGKTRTPVQPVSVTTACLTFLIFGLVFGGMSVAVLASISRPIALASILTAVFLFALAGWRLRSTLGFPVGMISGALYGLFFLAGVAGVTFITAF